MQQVVPNRDVMPAYEGNLHERLRAATRPLHTELELAVKIGERIRTRASYIDHLVRLFGLHVSAEIALQALNFTPLGFAYPSPYRSRLLAADLAELGVPPQAFRRSLPPAPRLGTIPAGLGCIYVLEGSAKGARAILPEITAALSLDAEKGATFFNGYGQETKLMWRALLSALNRIEPSSEEGRETVEAALETFRMFQRGLAVASDLYAQF
jgi:heme oxygenase